MDRVRRRDVIKVGAAGVVLTAAPGVSHSNEVQPIADKAEPRVTPFLAYFGDAEQAMNRYVGLFEDSRILSVERYGPGEVGKEGTVKVAEFTLNGNRIMCNDIPGEHVWTFTPAVSLSSLKALTRRH